MPHTFDVTEADAELRTREINVRVFSNGADNTTIRIKLNKTKYILSYQHLFICAVIIATCFDLTF
jgi:hypothetical protein